MAKTTTKIGDVFSVKLNDNYKKYLQYITNDATQLNSDVIRAFKKVWPIEADPELSSIVEDEVDFYAHCVTKWGIKMELWEKIGNIKNVGKFDHILFRDTSDYGIKPGQEPIKVSHKWYIWKINDKNFTSIGKLEGDYRNSYVGLVINPHGIIELLKGNKYPINYPE